MAQMMDQLEVEMELADEIEVDEVPPVDQEYLEDYRLLVGKFGDLGTLELLGRCFGRLGVHDLLNLRGVCRSWRDRLLKPSFRKLYPASGLGSDAIAVFRSSDEAGVWSPTTQQHKLGVKLATNQALCSEGGIICVQDDGQISLINPATNEWTELPALDENSVEVRRAGDLHRHGEAGYGVVVLYSLLGSEDVLQAKRYQPEANEWTPEVSCGVTTAESGPLSGSLCVYIDDVERLFAFDPQQSRWSFKQVAMPEGVKMIDSFVFNNQYYCAMVDDGGEDDVDEENAPVLGGVSVWLLGEAGQWILFSSITADESGNPNAFEDTVFNLLLVESKLYIFNVFGGWYPVVLDMEQGSWTCFPGANQPETSDWFEMAGCYVFRPDMSVNGLLPRLQPL